MQFRGLSFNGWFFAVLGAELVVFLGVGVAGSLGVALPRWVTFVPAMMLGAGMVTALGWSVIYLRALARRDRWEREGRCRGCGYDRRGLEIGERCPECGVGGIV